MINLSLYKTGNAQKIQVGYQISQIEDAIQFAYNKAAGYVRQAKQVGAELKEWGMIISIESNNFLKTALLRKEDKKNYDEATDWENEISKAIQLYFGSTTDILGELRRLNPPLTSTELEPFLNQILTDRRETLNSLRPLESVIQGLTKMKTALLIEP